LSEYVRQGLGIAWLPWSMAQSEREAGRLPLTGDRRAVAPLKVRLYRPKPQLHELAEAVWR
jgi:DNA-binding transcriptional LysR family regulator